MIINADSRHFKDLNEEIHSAHENEIIVDNCIGQRFMASGITGKNITINGTPGNALGAYLNGAILTINGNAQDATGDTMNDGKIIIHGNSGDATGYAMRGGEILVEGSVGYRGGIHMKAYKDKIPAVVIGETAGSFLGEYQAGGYIIVLNTKGEEIPVGNFCGTGMHGGKIFLKCEKLPQNLPPQVLASKATEEDMAEIESYISEFCREFNKDESEIKSGTFYVLTPNTKNPYKALYTAN